eukprot:RCo006336
MAVVANPPRGIMPPLVWRGAVQGVGCGPAMPSPPSQLSQGNPCEMKFIPELFLTLMRLGSKGGLRAACSTPRVLLLCAGRHLATLPPHLQLSSFFLSEEVGFHCVSQELWPVDSHWLALAELIFLRVPAGFD